MPFTVDQLRRIHDRTDGNCHICGKKTYFNNYGKFGARGAWEVEHSVCKANGGTSHGNNLYAAHISCNRSKGTCTSRTARSHNGRSRAPLSKDRKDNLQTANTAGGAAVGALIGTAFGPGGTLLGALVGGLLGNSIDPETR